MLGDASVYAVSLYILHRAARTQAKASLFKGVVMLAFGLGVIAEALHKALSGAVTPAADVMGVIGLLALAANALCFFLLYSHRADNLNMRSTWLCSRNDLIANMSVLFAAGLVAWTGSFWPDLLIGLAIAALFLASAWKVLSESLHVLKGVTTPLTSRS